MTRRRTTVDPSPNLQPSDIPDALNLAVQHHNAGDLASAGDVYRRILQTDPKNEDALHLLGLIAFHEKDLKKAVELMTEALGVNPVFPAAHNNLGAVYKAMERLDDAAASFRKAIDCQEDFAEAHFNLGNVLKVLNQSDEAVACYRKAIAINPEYIDAHNNLGVLFNSQGRLEDATECFRLVLGLSPESLDTHYNLGNTLRDLGRLEEAADSYRRVLDLEPGHLKAQYGLAALTDESTEVPPDGYVALAFDNFASQFEHQMDVGNCRIPEILRLLAGLLLDKKENLSVPPFARVLDIGCGTGLVGVESRNIAGELHGVDLSEKMLERARDKNVYDAVYQTDTERYLSETESLYDLILAGDVLIYTGPLEGLFAKVRDRLERGGMFAFSVERLDEGTYVLQASTRYAHSEEYILRLARDNGFQVIYNHPVEKMRNDVNGMMFWLEKAE